MTAAWAAWSRATPTARHMQGDEAASTPTRRRWTVTFEDGSTENITPSAIAHKNGRTIKGFSTGAQKKMYDDCPGCPYEDYTKFYNYYGSHTYADDWVTAALTGGKTTQTPRARQHRLLEGDQDRGTTRPGRGRAGQHVPRRHAQAGGEEGRGVHEHVDVRDPRVRGRDRRLQEAAASRATTTRCTRGTRASPSGRARSRRRTASPAASRSTRSPRSAARTSRRAARTATRRGRRPPGHHGEGELRPLLPIRHRRDAAQLRPLRRGAPGRAPGGLADDGPAHPGHAALQLQEVRPRLPERRRGFRLRGHPGGGRHLRRGDPADGARVQRRRRRDHLRHAKIALGTIPGRRTAPTTRRGTR